MAYPGVDRTVQRLSGPAGIPRRSLPAGWQAIVENQRLRTIGQFAGGGNEAGFDFENPGPSIDQVLAAAQADLGLAEPVGSRRKLAVTEILGPVGVVFQTGRQVVARRGAMGLVGNTQVNSSIKCNPMDCQTVVCTGGACHGKASNRTEKVFLQSRVSCLGLKALIPRTYSHYPFETRFHFDRNFGIKFNFSNLPFTNPCCANCYLNSMEYTIE